MRSPRAGPTESGGFVSGEALEMPDTAMMVRTRDGNISMTDGPFMEAPEMPGGIVTIKAGKNHSDRRRGHRLRSIRLALLCR
ncbi:hypothetical protein [Bosea sp. (in: a-proteobacteria)]|uniref:hypothetical protein n=1 Tax=Bosea sp. (in: a-proteobacteria) TaxID=1871050 RepID=UPI002FC61A3C